MAPRKDDNRKQPARKTVKKKEPPLPFINPTQDKKVETVSHKRHDNVSNTTVKIEIPVFNDGSNEDLLITIRSYRRSCEAMGWTTTRLQYQNFPSHLKGSTKTEWESRTEDDDKGSRRKL
jgi:hypothetical protein